jgi:hypothetical protein
MMISYVIDKAVGAARAVARLAVDHDKRVLVDMEDRGRQGANRQQKTRHERRAK